MRAERAIRYRRNRVIGDRVLLFYLGEPRADEGYALLRVSVERELVHEIRGGTTRVPHVLRAFADHPRPIDAIVRVAAAH